MEASSGATGCILLSHDRAHSLELGKQIVTSPSDVAAGTCLPVDPVAVANDFAKSLAGDVSGCSVTVFFVSLEDARAAHPAFLVLMEHLRTALEDALPPN
jgi:hypothetical protein